MFTLNQTSVSRRPLVPPALLETALCTTDCPLGVFSSRTNRATIPPFAYDAQIVRPKPIGMNTCTKTGEGEGTFRESALKLLIFPSRWESYSCTKTMDNSHEIILFQKNRGGAPEALLEILSSFVDWNASVICPREKMRCSQLPALNLITRVGGIPARAQTVGHMLRESMHEHTSLRHCCD